jgi:proline iminopeptidase
MKRAALLFLTVLAACSAHGVQGPPMLAPHDGYFVAAEGVRLHYSAFGTGPDTVVLVHGQQGNTADYLAPDLLPLGEGRVLIAYTQRGGGLSDAVTEPQRLGIQSHVADLEALRIHFGLERLSLLAHSGGAGIAVRYALAHPERVHRMLLFGSLPPALADFYPDAMQRFAERFDSTELAELSSRRQALATAGDPVAVCRDVFGTVLRKAYLTDPSAADRMRGDFCSAPPERLRTELTRLRAFQQSLGAWDWREELRTLSVPVLVVHGADDAIPEAAARAWVEALPNARLLLLPLADHFPHLDRPEVFFPAAETFFRGGWPAAAPSSPE